MKIKTLLDQYKFSLKTYDIMMPITIIFWVIAGIVAFVLNPVWWLGLIFIALGAICSVMYALIRKYLKRKIKELQKQEEQKQPADGNGEQRSK